LAATRVMGKLGVTVGMATGAWRATVAAKKGSEDMKEELKVATLVLVHRVVA